MKITFFVLILLCTAAAFGQTGAGVLSSQPVVMWPSSHPQHAEVHGMATESPIVGGGAITTAHGEVPLWEFGSPYPEPTPLGDVARAYRKEKLSARKAEKVFEKQGS